jgi:hypothetical protein
VVEVIAPVPLVVSVTARPSEVSDPVPLKAMALPLPVVTFTTGLEKATGVVMSTSPLWVLPMFRVPAVI